MNSRNLYTTVLISLMGFSSIGAPVLLAAEPAAASPRLWVSRGGQYLRGTLIRVDGNAVVIQDSRGKMAEVYLADLSIEDQRFAEKAANRLASNGRPHRGSVASPRNDSPQSVLVDRDGSDLEPPPRPEPDNLLPAPTNFPAEPTRDDSAPNASSGETAKLSTPKQLPKAIRTLRRLLNANADASNDGGSPLFGPESSVYISFSGKFLNEFIQVPIDQNGPVEELIMGMPVAGTADTQGVATLYLRPSPDHAAFEIVASGRADSLTSGQQLLVNIESDGTTHFEARKRLEISTEGIDLFEASATAQTTVNQAAVSTQLPGRIGSLVGRIAGRIVEANRPQIDYEASERAAYRAAKELDLRIDSEVVRVQQVLSEIAPGLAAGKPVIPIRFRTSKDRVAILIGEYEPQEWIDFDKQVSEVGQDITIVLPKKTVSTAKQLQMAMRLLSISLEEHLGGIKPEELEPTTQNWSPDKEWLTLTWDVDATIVELLSKDFLDSTSVGAFAKPAPRVQPTPYYPDVPSWNQGGRRPDAFRIVP